MINTIAKKEKLVESLQTRIIRYETKLKNTPFWDTKSKKYVERKLTDLRVELSVQKSLLYRLKDL